MKLVRLTLIIALMVAVSVSIIGCGQHDNGVSSVDGIIAGDAASRDVSEVTIIKTTTTESDATEVTYHFETNLEVPFDLVVGLEIKSIDNEIENAVVVIRKGTDISESFSFEETVQQITVLEHKDLLDFESSVLAINSENLSIDFNEYPLYQRPYVVSGDGEIFK